MNSQLSFFDCNAQIGRYSVKHPEAFTTSEKLVEEMEYSGISEALVYHALAKEYAPSVGNELLMNEIHGKPLHPCWVVMPHHTGEMPPPDSLLAEMKRFGVRALRVFPVQHQFSLSDWCSGELLDMAEANRVPVFLDFDQINWEGVAQVMRDHPKLNLVLLRTSYRVDRYLYPLLERYENLRIECATYQVAGGIEAICRRFGAERLIFGTGLPIFEAGPCVAQITYADISGAEKRLIAGDNLREMLAWADCSVRV